MLVGKATISQTETPPLPPKQFKRLKKAMRKFIVERNDSQLSLLLKQFDCDSEGKILRDDLKATLLSVKTSFITDTDINNLLEEADENEDGKIDPKEFLEMMKECRDSYLIY